MWGLVSKLLMSWFSWRPRISLAFFYHPNDAIWALWRTPWYFTSKINVVTLLLELTESYVWIAALSKLFVYWMHCPVGWQNQTQLSHKVAPGSTWNLFRLIKHTLIEYSAVVIFDPPWSKLSYKPLLLSKPKSTSPLLPKMRENERAFLNVRFSAI